MNADFRVKQFEEFYDCLMQNAPEGYIPWFFPCKAKGKDPDTHGSWHDEKFRLNKEQCIERIRLGGNIGISARKGDPLIIGDIDELEQLSQMPKDTLTTTSRKRQGGHFFGWDKDGSAKKNVPTNYGELRSCNQYVLACGSYTPFDHSFKKDREAFEKLTKDTQEDKLLGYYTIDNKCSPKEMGFEDLPEFFKEASKADEVSDSEVLQREEVSSYDKGEGKYSELFKLKVSDIVGKSSSAERKGHPLHDSETDANWSLNDTGTLGYCWRHGVTLNGVQFLAVKAGYVDCQDAGIPHNSKKKDYEGRKFSKIKGDKKAFEVAYNEALKLGLIKKWEGKKEKKELEDINETSKIIDDEKEIIVEQIYDEKNGCRFCIYNNKDGSVNYEKTYTHNGVKYFPITGEEITKGVVLLPTEAIDYIDDETLDNDINSFSAKWLDVPEETRRFGLMNVKVSYVFDKFHTLNYLRVLGDTGTGKTRYLDTWGYIHYKPIFTNGNTTAAPLFRIIDKWRGTLVMDEADLKNSDESEQVIKVLNNGFEKNKFIMRCDQTDAKKIAFFDPFCPKILSTRRSFQDKATESRCITHVSSVTNRKDIPLNLTKEFFDEALVLRNKLLMWGFRNYFGIKDNVEFDLGDVEPRVKQIVGSYISLFSTDEKQMEKFKQYIQNYQEELTVERQSSFDGAIVGAIHKILNKGILNFDSKDVIEEGQFTDRNGKIMNPRGLTSSLKSLGFKKSEAKKVGGKTKRCIPIEQEHIDKIFKRYGYAVTVVTVVTDTSKINNEGKKETKTRKQEELGANRIHRNNRNSVTKREIELCPECNAPMVDNKCIGGCE